MIAAAATLLRRQGYQGTGLNQILAEAGAPKGSMYFHFPGGKEQLGAEAIAASGEYVDRALQAHDAGDARRSLEHYLDDVALGLERSGFLDGCPIATTALEVAAPSDLLGDACAAALDGLVDRVTGWLVADGLAADEAAERAFLVYAAIEGALVFAKAHRSSEPLRRLRRRLPSLLGTGG
jgi:AcrR family transcriptional regulator